MIRFQKNVSLAGHVAYKIGGRARYFFQAKNIAALKAALQKAYTEKLKVFVVGEGTNLLVHDKGFDGLVVRPAFTWLSAKGTRIHAGAGVPMRRLVAFAARRGLSGLEWAGGLPGTVGGAIRGNAGAFGGEIKDSIARVKSLNIRTLRTLERVRRACRFGYRSSIFKKRMGEEIVLEAVFELRRGDVSAIRKSTEEKISYRKARHPLEFPNVGSIFKNVDVREVPRRILPRVAHVIKKDPFPVVPAAYLISEAGMKGVRVGGAEVSPKHPNFIVNRRNARAADVKKLIARVQRAVKKKFGILLEPEVQIL
ncbi:MAG: UDP-N-acetylmuramate dehydrogenase [Candidatus Liptonbacteria bacterium]|nr:UDP-N-acetylmuramate dehydrogenase [Candidatus Liptonbacteria bacterium]